MEVPSLLCNSYLCRLCANENKNSTKIFPIEENDPDLSQLINKYLPVKVANDGKFPQLICPGCYIQVEATKQFLDLIIEGQKKLRDLYLAQEENLKLQEKRRQQLENTLKNYNPESSVKTYIQTDESGKKFFIQVLTDGPLFPPEHELSLRAEGLERPRRRRGRPPKSVQNTEESETQKEANEENKDYRQESEEDPDGDGRRKRKIKAPSRFQEVVQGKELERIFKEVGVIDDDSLSEDEHQKNNSEPGADEVIGHLQSKEGDDLGELIIVNKSTNRIRHKPKHDTSPKRKKKHECEVCGKEFLHYGRYEVHRLIHKDANFECRETSCNVRASTKAAIEQHQKETGHSGITLLESIKNYGEVQQPKSEEIQENTEDNIENSVDIKLEENSNIELSDTKINDTENSSNGKHACDVCGKTFTCRQNLDVHVKAVHENLKPHQCEKCNKSFPYLNSLKCHLLKHVDKNEKLYPCEVCNKVFNHPSSLVYHQEAEHNNGRRFVCIKCNKSFKHKQLLQRHQLVHSDERPHRCKLCDASFKTRANLINHMPIHTGEKKYFCSQCGHAFAHKTSLTLHTRWHSGQKPYQCDVCLKSFSQKGNLAEHTRIHTGEKPYCCDHCGRRFTTSSQYKLHVKRHTGERPWRCEYCSKTFLHKDTWKCHMRRHRNERPYQCQLCFRCFTEQWALKKHERLHTGEKPYVCEYCNKSFADCSNLTKHKKVHANENLRKFKLLTTTMKEDQNIYYLTLDPSSSDDQAQTLVHIMDPLDSTVNETESLTGTNIADENELLASNSPMRDAGLQVQEIFDQDGNPLSVTLSDGQAVRVVTTVEDGQQNIQGLMTDGTLVPMNISIEDGKAIITDMQVPTEDESGKENKLEEMTSKKIIEPKSEVSSIGQLLENNIQFLNENGQKLENNMQFLMEDGQNICFVTTYNTDDTINPQYLAMA